MPDTDPTPRLAEDCATCATARHLAACLRDELQESAEYVHAGPVPAIDCDDCGGTGQALTRDGAALLAALEPHVRRLVAEEVAARLAPKGQAPAPECPDCEGRGRQWSGGKVCPACQGSGRLPF